MKAYGFKAVLFTLFEFDYRAQDEFLRSSFYRAKSDLHLQSHLNKARKAYNDIKASKTKSVR